MRFGRYELVEKIATGGMAEIFYAKLTSVMGFEKGLVIKRILPHFAEDPRFLRMFVTEAKLVCHLSHPNIVQVYELGEIDGQFYIAMEYVNGIDGRKLWRTLAKRRQRLPGALALYIVGESLKALEYAHQAVGPDGKLLGVVHRDVSPSNVLISFRGDVKISDFGIALVQQESKTQTGTLKGKFGYMSPEQVAGRKVDHRSDIFSSGVVLTELLLGRRLFKGPSDFETLDKVKHVRLEVLEKRAHTLDPEIFRIVRQSLTRDIHDRYPSAREFYREINEYLYRNGFRITNESLAAFLEKHVTPHLLLLDSRIESPQSPVLKRSVTPDTNLIAVSPAGQKLDADRAGQAKELEEPIDLPDLDPEEADLIPDSDVSEVGRFESRVDPQLMVFQQEGERHPPSPRIAMSPHRARETHLVDDDSSPGDD